MKIVARRPKGDEQIAHFELVLKVVSPAEAGVTGS
jgi:hypothetical protein